MMAATLDRTSAHDEHLAGTTPSHHASIPDAVELARQTWAATGRETPDEVAYTSEADDRHAAAVEAQQWLHDLSEDR